MKIWTSVKFQRTFSRKNIPFDNLNICVSINFVSNIRFLFITGYYWTSVDLYRISEDSDYLYKTSIDFQKNFFSKKKKKKYSLWTKYPHFPNSINFVQTFVCRRTDLDQQADEFSRFHFETRLYVEVINYLARIKRYARSRNEILWNFEAISDRLYHRCLII